MKSPALSFLADTVSLYFEKRVSQSAAELAFFSTLTFFPLLICAHALADLLHVNEAPFWAIISNVIPKSSLSVLTDYFQYISGNQSTALLIGGLILLFTSSSAAFRSLLRIMGDLYGKPLFSGLRHFILSFLAPIFLLVFLHVSVALLLTGEWFTSFLINDLSLSIGILSIWYWFRFLLLFALFFIALFLYYRIPVRRKKKHRRPPVIWGTLFASVVLVGLSIIFSWFIELSSRYQLVYGSLAAIIILMVWLYLCGQVIILGNVINFVREKYWKARRLSG